MQDDTAQRFAGIDRLYGRGSAARLSTQHVCVVGVGGVGSWAAEALVRSGIGAVTLIDADEVCVSNVNRQSHALDGAFGRAKVDVLGERLLAINPRLRLTRIPQFLTPSNLPELLGGYARHQHQPVAEGRTPSPGSDRPDHVQHDLVLDACDAFRVKVETIAFCRRRKQPLVVIGSAGGRTDPTQVRVRDLSRTEHDAMLALIRRKLRGEFNFPRNKDRYFGVPAVYSLENVRYPQADGSVCGVRPQVAGEEGFRLDCGGGLGAAMHVTASFAMAAVGVALERLLRPSATPAPRVGAAHGCDRKPPT